MTLYLSNKQIVLLAIPVIIAGGLYYFEDDILKYMHTVLPKHNMKKSELLTQEANKYLRIKRNKNKYDEISEKIILRKKFIEWMQNHLIYKKIDVIDRKSRQKSLLQDKWRLEAVFPKYDKAIINNKFVHIGSNIDRATVIEIDFDKVLLKTAKGLKWIHLFH